MATRDPGPAGRGAAAGGTAVLDPDAAPAAYCPHCRAALEPDQAYCLECGERLTVLPPSAIAADPILSEPDRRLRILGAPFEVALLAAGLLILAFVAAYLVAGGDDGATPTTTALAAGVAPVVPGAVVPVTPLPTTPAPGAVPTTPGSQLPGPGATPIVPTDVVPTAPATAPPATTTTPPTSTGGTDTTISPTPSPKPTPSPSASGGGGSTDTVDWPASKSGFTVIAWSLRTESDARAKAAALRGDGVKAQVTNSSAFSSLRPGYWVVFSGVYDTLPAARAALPAVRAKMSTAYTRRMVPG